MERPPPPQGGTGLNQRIAGLPTWGWIGIAAAGGIVLLLWFQRRNTAAPGATTASTVASSDDQTGALETLAAQIRDLQGANSQPLPSQADRGLYYFGIQGDSSPTTRYIGIPGVGYYGVPGIDVANSFLKSHPKTIDLGVIPAGDAATRFGTSLPWSSIGASGRV